MSEKTFVERVININATAQKVWQVFTDPVVTRQMGGEYVSDWKVGSSFGWKNLDGDMLTNGTILKIEPENLLQHELFNAVGTVNSVITYTFNEHDGQTELRAREDFTNPITDGDYADAVEGWDIALGAVKDLAEK